MAHGPETSGIHRTITYDLRMTNLFVYVAALQQRYSELGKMANDIKKKQKLDVVRDKKFPTLKRKWFLVKDYLIANPGASDAEQAEFANDILNGSNNDPAPNPVVVPQPWALPSFTTAGYNVFRGQGVTAFQQAGPRSNEDHSRIKDPDFVARLRPLEQRFPVLSKITDKIYTCLKDDLRALENRCLRDYVRKITSSEQKRANDGASAAREINSQNISYQAFQNLLRGLRDAMGTNVK
jgi:hypothetical protein